MSRLFTYILRYDAGAAPNPFRGMCSLAICKPRIRQAARTGDWVAGVGSTCAPSGDLSGRLVYAMQVGETMSLEEYDQRAPEEWPHRIPNVASTDLSERLGDCIYDYSSGGPVQRAGVHGPASMARDLSGENVLISAGFYYFGSRAIPLPEDLLVICPRTQGHRSNLNDPYVDRFISWLGGLGLAPGQLYGWPDLILDWAEVASCGGCLAPEEEGEAEEDVVC
jgi:hypothetical protein